MIETDQAILNQARNRVTYGDYRNSLVEWTLSDEWTDLAKFQGTKQPRGLVNRAGLLVTCTSCEGEIS